MTIQYIISSYQKFAAPKKLSLKACAYNVYRKKQHCHKRFVSNVHTIKY